ncbi:hypothetical protein ASA_P4G108 (plasmid) [Aeromonas salmonicida subsp. salmonicida A449]|uniref:Uncharacterized protein n=2 Tax=Aeromonas salmonicida subsp. salmonicida TaxID=29491 RepID=A0A189PGU1_AERSS|nr:hypothetical protein ASA_P4G108 [Aeromonas salmonicida subsp. salmonicida A449]ALL42248.1 hypothetical protein [Aeromonas salmonicida subsp. salmonicida]ALL42404.1 hypothetical protein [Aeromonas salmonicida subsp. salmonicida]
MVATRCDHHALLAAPVAAFFAQQRPLVNPMLSRRKPQELVVSESDITAALAHLKTQPYRTSLPKLWDRQRLLNRVREVVGPRPERDKCYQVGARLYAIIQPFAVDLISDGQYDDDGRLQVCLLIRPCGTDPTRVTIL